MAAALAEPEVRAVVARGPAGAGKTALIAAALDLQRRAGALTGAAAHLQDDPGQSIGPVIGAIEQAVAAGLEQLFDPGAGLESLARVLRTQASVFASFGTGLLRSLDGGDLPPAPSAEAADERVVQACIATLRWLTGFGQPVMLQLDDWGRGGERARRLLERLFAEPDLGLLRVLATERPDERSALADHADCRVIEIGPIDPAARRALVADLLPDVGEAAEPILRFLGSASELPFDLIQATNALVRSGAVSRGEARWALDAVRAARALAEATPERTLVAFIRGQPGALDLAQAVALSGETAQAGDLQALTGLAPEALSRTAAALEESGLTRWREGQLQLTHDRLRREVLGTLTPQARRRLCARLAECLRQRGAAPDSDPRGVVMLWRRLDGGLDGVDAGGWADLFGIGARTARQVGDRAAAGVFAEAALDLAERVGDAPHAILKEAVFAAVEREDHVLARERSERLLRGAVGLREQAEADELRIYARRTAGDLPGAIAAAREGLARAGVRIPARPTLLDVAATVLSVLVVDPDRAARRAPLSDDDLAQAAPMMRAVNATGSLLFEHDLWMAVVLAAGSIPPELAAGSSAGAAVYAFVCSMTGQYRRAAKWASLSDARQSAAQPMRAVGAQFARAFGHYFVRPRQVLFEAIDEVETLAFADGDLAVAAYMIQDRVRESLMGPAPLARTIDLAVRGHATCARFKDPAITWPHAAMHQAAVHLAQGGAEPWRLAGAIYDPADFERATDGGLANARRLIGMIEALLAVSYGAYDEAARLHGRLKGLLLEAPFSGWMESWTFLTGVALFRTGGRPGGLGLVNMRRLARLNPADKAHRVLLFDAEAARLAGRRRRAMILYERAERAARESGSLVEWGIVAEAAAEGARMLGDRAAADLHGASAREAWGALGAEGVLRHRHPGASAAPDAGGRLADLRRRVAELEEGQAHREAELHTARESAERANRAKSRFLAAIGHELRTPLQGLVGLVDLSRQAGAPLEMETLAATVNHLRTVVSDLTDLGALEGGVFPLSPRPFDAAAACRAAVALHEGAARQAGRSIRLIAPTRPTTVLGDEARVMQILSNLLGNAVKHGAGEVTLRLDVGAEEPGGALAFTVTDEGPGLEPGFAARLFEPFERGAAAEAVEGLGLGLPLARALARRMGGDLRVLDDLPRGVGFQFVLPAHRAPAAPAATPLPTARLRVLVAEDAPLSRRVIAALLRAQGCEVEEAEDGGAAVELCRSGAFDLVLLDLRMPVMDGLQAAGAILQAAGAAPVVVIATSAPTQALEDAAADLGVAAVLAKPVGWAELARALRLSTAPTPEPEAVAGERDRLRDLRGTLGRGAEPLIAQAPAALRSSVEGLEAALAAADPAAVAACAHALAGLAANFGLDALREAAVEIERTGASTAAEMARLHEAARAAQTRLAK